VENSVTLKICETNSDGIIIELFMTLGVVQILPDSANNISTVTGIGVFLKDHRTGEGRGNQNVSLVSVKLKIVFYMI